jgi:nucleoside 2-deoxyribosyltransferase
MLLKSATGDEMGVIYRNGKPVERLNHSQAKRRRKNHRKERFILTETEKVLLGRKMRL